MRKNYRRAGVISAFAVGLCLVGWWLSGPRASTRQSALLVAAVRDPNADRVCTLLDQGADPNVQMDFTGESKPLTLSRMLKSMSGQLSYADTVLMQIAVMNANERKWDFIRGSGIPANRPLDVTGTRRWDMYIDL